MRRSSRALPVAIALLLAIAAAPVGAQQAGSVRTICADCHAGAGPDKWAALEHADSVSCLTCHHIGFTNDPDLAEARRDDACVACHADGAAEHSVHRALPGGYDAPATPECTTCHVVHGDPPAAEAGGVISGRCASCHTQGHALHSDIAAADAPPCASCHGEHAIEAGPESASRTCSDCHEAPHPSHRGAGIANDCASCHALDATVPVAQDEAALLQSCASCHSSVQRTHVQAHPDEAPTCVACHAFASDPPLGEAAVGMSSRCGDCHEGEMTAYASGGHAWGLERGEADLPTCASCHTAHGTIDGDRGRLRIRSTAACVACHSDQRLLEKYDLPEWASSSYLDDYHGATAEFLGRGQIPAGTPLVMVCSDCHGPHEVGWEPGASVADVCVSCHAGADAKLAGAWIGHARVGPSNRIAVWAVRIFYYFMIPFVLVGLLLNVVFNLVHQRRKGARMLEAHGIRRLWARLRGQPLPPEPSVTRFTLTERMEHLGAMITFPLLVITGLPQTAPRAGISQAIIGLFGGIASTRLVHRVTGFVFVALLVVHVARGVRGMVRRRTPPDMTPTRKDFFDVVGLVRHMVANTPRPKVGKFDAAEKFEYWGLFFGGIIMSVTGLALIYPELVTEVVPGMVLAVMRTVHGFEATFAVLVVVLWHSYGVIFRPEIFPLDTSIFTGEISVERLKEEHELEYERLFANTGSDH